MDNKRTDGDDKLKQPLVKNVLVSTTLLQGALNYRPLVFCALSLVLGITAAAAVNGNRLTLIVIYVLLALFLAAGIVLAFLKKRLVVWVALFILVGFFLYNTNYFAASTGDFVVEDAVLTGRVAATEQKYYEYNVYLIEEVRIDAAYAKGNAYLYTENVYDVGTRLSARGSLASFDWNPFDYSSMSYYNSGVKYTMIAEHINFISMDELGFFEKIRERIKDGYPDLLSEDGAGIALSLVLGDKSLMPLDTKDYFRASGLSHIFAVSGLHIGFLIATIIFICRKLKLGKHSALALSFAAMLCYGLITGFPASITRAIIMTLAGFLGYILYRRPDPLNALALAAIIILLLKPFSLFDLGFQLSFSAVLGIVCFYKPLKKRLTLGKSRFARLFSNSLALSLSANSLLFAVSVNAFSALGVYFCLSNIIVIPVVAILYAALMAATLAFLIYPSLGILIVLLDYPFIGLKYIAQFIAGLPGAMAATHGIGLLSVVYVFAMLYMSRFFMVEQKKKYRVLMGLLGFSLMYAIVFL